MKRLLLILLQIVISAEITLQLVALALPAWTSRSDAGVAGDVTILCVGDSHTFGAPLPAEESYPAQLQALLDAQEPGRFRVVNLGVPGMNSAMMASRLDANLAKYRPDLLILWAGANNIWNEKESESWDREGAQDWPYRLLLRLKLVRLGRFLVSGVARPEVGRQAELVRWGRGIDTQWRVGDETLEMRRASDMSTERAAKGTRHDLPRMVRLARAYGVPVLLVTYPYPEFHWVNDAIRDVARELDVPLIESLEAREQAWADGHVGDDLVVMAAGPHPRAPLYGYIVRLMLPRVLALLEHE